MTIISRIGLILFRQKLVDLENNGYILNICPPRDLSDLDDRASRHVYFGILDQILEKNNLDEIKYIISVISMISKCIHVRISNENVVDFITIVNVINNSNNIIDVEEKFDDFITSLNIDNDFDENNIFTDVMKEIGELYDRENIIFKDKLQFIVDQINRID